MKKGKKSRIIGGVVAAIVIGVIVIQFSSVNEDLPIQDNDLPEIVDVDNDGVPDEVDRYVATPRVWEKQTSGPFQIDREQYLLGELVLLRIGVTNQLNSNDIGQVVFLQPSNGTHQTVYISIPFDGTESFSFNQYFKPALSQNRGICSTADLLGNWTVFFQGTDGKSLYENLEFEIVDRYIPGEEENYEEPVC